MFDTNPIEVYSDREKIRNQMIQYMKTYLDLENLDLNKSSYLAYLIDILSGLTANLMFYNSSTYRNFFLTKAVDEQAVLSWASMLGYTPPLATPSTVQVLVGMPTTFDPSVVGSQTYVTIPKGFKYKSKNFEFEQNHQIVVTLLNPGTTSVSATVVEHLDIGGTKLLPVRFNADKTIVYFAAAATQESTEEFEFTIPTLEPYQFYNVPISFEGNLSDISVVTRDPSTTSSSDQTWKRYDSLYLIPSQDEGFSYRKTQDGIVLFFGNGVIGKQPTAGSILEVSVSTTEGASGNVISGSITDSDSLYSTDNIPVTLEVINTSPATGGTDEASIDDVRSAALANVSAGTRLVSELDYRNMDYIVENLPINNAISVLKRSDLKSNEVAVFTDLLFEDYVVPTRNAVWTLDADDFSDATTGAETGIMKVTSQDVITIDGEEYYSLFNIDVDTDTRDAQYYYNVDDTSISLSINRTYTNETQILPTSASFNTVYTLNPDNHYVEVEMNYQKVVDDDLSGMTCKFYTTGNDIPVTMTHDYSNRKFTKDILLSEFGNNEQNAFFQVKDSSGDAIVESQGTVVIKRDLREFMSSQVDFTRDISGDVVEATIYDVPVVKKEFYDGLTNVNAFKLTPLQQFMAFDVLGYRMLTTFVNLKLSNTTGKLNNMRFNPSTHNEVDDFLPDDISDSTNGVRYVVVCDDNPWDKESGFIAEYVEGTDTWVYEELSNKDIFYVTSLGEKLIYNGCDAVSMEQDIPLQVDISVWKDPLVNITNTTLIERIKDELIDNFINTFGYDQPFYRAEFIRVVKSIDGVLDCVIHSPNQDIFFDYDPYNDLTEEELLLYSPQLVYFDTNSINVEVKI